MSDRRKADELFVACDSRPSNAEMERVHHFSTNNRFAVGGSAEAGCFYCCKIWEPAGTAIADYCNVDEEATDGIGNATVLCPFCRIDSVISSIDVGAITPKLLKDLNTYWFGTSRPLRDE